MNATAAPPPVSAMCVTPFDDDERRDEDDLPSAYVERHAHFTYITDTVGVRHRDEIGVDRILWSSDYPHISADWPYSWRTIQASLAGVPAEEKALILAGTPRGSTALAGSQPCRSGSA